MTQIPKEGRIESYKIEYFYLGTLSENLVSGFVHPPTHICAYTHIETSVCGSKLVKRSNDVILFTISFLE